MNNLVMYVLLAALLVTVVLLSIFMGIKLNCKDCECASSDYSSSSSDPPGGSSSSSSSSSGTEEPGLLLARPRTVNMNIDAKNPYKVYTVDSGNELSAPEKEALVINEAKPLLSAPYDPKQALRRQALHSKRPAPSALTDGVSTLVHVVLYLRKIKVNGVNSYLYAPNAAKPHYIMASQLISVTDTGNSEIVVDVPSLLLNVMEPYAQGVKTNLIEEYEFYGEIFENLNNLDVNIGEFEDMESATSSNYVDGSVRYRTPLMTTSDITSVSSLTFFGEPRFEESITASSTSSGLQDYTVHSLEYDASAIATQLGVDAFDVTMAISFTDQGTGTTQVAERSLDDTSGTGRNEIHLASVTGDHVAFDWTKNITIDFTTNVGTGILARLGSGTLQWDSTNMSYTMNIVYDTITIAPSIETDFIRLTVNLPDSNHKFTVYDAEAGSSLTYTVPEYLRAMQENGGDAKQLYMTISHTMADMGSSTVNSVTRELYIDSSYDWYAGTYSTAPEVTAISFDIPFPEGTTDTDYSSYSFSVSLYRGDSENDPAAQTILESWDGTSTSDPYQNITYSPAAANTTSIQYILTKILTTTFYSKYQLFLPTHSAGTSSILTDADQIEIWDDDKSDKITTTRYDILTSSFGTGTNYSYINYFDGNPVASSTTWTLRGYESGVGYSTEEWEVDFTSSVGPGELVSLNATPV